MQRSITLTKQGGTYPRLLVLHDGTHVLSYTTGPPDGKQLPVTHRSHSGDKGIFSTYGMVTSASGPQDLDNLHIAELPPGCDYAGNLVAAFRNHDLKHGKPTHYRITCCGSTDGGKTWKYLSQIQESSTSNGLWEPFLRIGDEGALQCYFAREADHGRGQEIVRMISRNGGKNWGEESLPIPFDAKRVFARPGMPGVAKSFDERRGEARVMVFEENRTPGKMAVFCQLSYDDGASWGQRSPIFAARHGHNAGAPQIASFEDGSLAAVFMTDDNLPDHEVKWPHNAQICLCRAAAPVNGLLKWSEPQAISRSPCKWPGITSLGGGQCLAVWEGYNDAGKLGFPVGLVVEQSTYISKTPTGTSLGKIFNSVVGQAQRRLDRSH